MKKVRLVIATTKSWNIKNARSFKKLYKNIYQVYICSDKNKLTHGYLEKIDPEYIFFPHWSWFIDKNIFRNYPCVVFHMTDLPFGRGGSPLQNLILRKVYQTKVSAIKVAEGFDSGEVYLKRAVDISAGNAQEMYQRISQVVFSDMIPYILRKKPPSEPQQGKVVTFKRRTPEESDMSKAAMNTLRDVYDFVRMLDAEGYPRAFIRLNKNLKLELYNIRKKNGSLKGSFEVKYEH